MVIVIDAPPPVTDAEHQVYITEEREVQNTVSRLTKVSKDCYKRVNTDPPTSITHFQKLEWQMKCCHRKFPPNAYHIN